MKLKTGEPLWPALSPPRVTAKPLEANLECQAVVLGAGVTGAIAACLLAEAGVDTVVIDRRGAVRGSTAASTALLLYELDTPLIELTRRLGPDNAANAYRCCRRALDDLANLIDRYRINCDFRWTQSLFLAVNDDDQDWLERECEARSRLGIEVEFLKRRELRNRFDIDRPAALYSHAAIEADPFKLSHGLLCVAQNMGMQLYQADVSIDSSDGHSTVLSTREGLEIRCESLVVATGYETPELFTPLRSLSSIRTTYALASEPIETDAWPGRCLIWEAGDPYLYARQTADNRVIVGGADELDFPSNNRAALVAKSAELQRKLASLRPELRIEPAYEWSGAFAQTEDGLPFIGTCSRWPRVYFALGYGGNGITFSLLAGQINRDAILGRRNADAGVFGFDRASKLNSQT